MSRPKWIGVDLDCTLAIYTDFHAPIGAPIGVMVERVKQWLASGRTVKIMTARACSNQPANEREEQVTKIKAWCVKHIGQELEVTSEKDFDMIELWDDRAVAVMPNSGEQMSHSRLPVVSVN